LILEYFFDQFHGIDSLPSCLLSYFLTLIPKVKSPQQLSDFRPISLIGCWYKLLSKVLARRLATVIGELIPKTQSAFLKGRQLVEGVVVVNEVIDFAKKAGRECMIFKVDFERHTTRWIEVFLTICLVALVFVRSGGRG
jgi:hypothetical protein